MRSYKFSNTLFKKYMCIIKAFNAAKPLLAQRSLTQDHMSLGILLTLQPGALSVPTICISLFWQGTKGGCVQRSDED